MSQRPILRSLIPVLLASGVALAIAVYWLSMSGSLGGIEGGKYTVKVVAPSAAGLASGTSVRMAGIPIGRVSAVRRRPDGALIALKIKDKYGPLPSDSLAAIRLRTLVGENYISITRGRSAQRISDGGLLPLDHANEYVEVDQILSVLRGKTRERTRQMFRGLARGLDGHGTQLNNTVDDVGGFIRGASPVVDVLHRDRQQIARLVDNLGSVTRAVAERGASLRAAAQDSRTTFQSIAASDSAVRALLAELPGTMRQARLTSQTLRRVSATASPTITDLAGTIRALGPAVRELWPAAKTARTTVHELGAASPALTTTLAQLRRFSGPAAKALPKLSAVFCQINPALEYLRPYAKEIPTVLQDLGSTTNWYDATGHAARLFATIGSNDLGAFTPTMAKMVDTLLTAGLIGKRGPMRGYNPLPKPGNVGDVTDGAGVSGPSDVHQHYPRIKAAC